MTNQFDDLALAAASLTTPRRTVLRMLAGGFVLSLIPVDAARRISVEPSRRERTLAASTDDACTQGVRTAWTPACTHPVTKQGYVNSYNGCGPANGWLSKYLPDFPMGANFRSACNSHDLCYGTCGSDKGTCDSTFHGSMLKACADKFAGDGVPSALGRGICNTVADDYWAAVVLKGQDAFEAAQKQACDCCACVDGCPDCYSCNTASGPNGTCVYGCTNVKCGATDACYASFAECYADPNCPFQNIDWCVAADCTIDG